MAKINKESDKNQQKIRQKALENKFKNHSKMR